MLAGDVDSLGKCGLEGRGLRMYLPLDCAGYTKPFIGLGRRHAAVHGCRERVPTDMQVTRRCPGGRVVCVEELCAGCRGSNLGIVSNRMDRGVKRRSNTC
jgi:hypothetical protein